MRVAVVRVETLTAALVDRVDMRVVVRTMVGTRLRHPERPGKLCGGGMLECC